MTEEEIEMHLENLKLDPVSYRPSDDGGLTLTVEIEMLRNVLWSVGCLLAYLLKNRLENKEASAKRGSK